MGAKKRLIRRDADRDLGSAATFLVTHPLPARDFIPGRTPGTLGNSIGVNGHDGL